ncbi:MAG: DUF2169 domain-containing protein [Nannocystaceae bacterium]
MWGLNNHTEYAAERAWVRDKTGHHHWVVAVKGTFEITAAGDLRLADEQLPPLMAPEYFGEPGMSSLRFDTDLVQSKGTTEVLVNAHAYAPGGRPVDSVPVQMRVGAISKTLVVHGPRVYCKGAWGLTTTAPMPFVRCPIRYEEAYGGSDMSDPDPRRQRMDPRNPVGRGVSTRTADLINTAAHRVEYLQGDPSRVGPAGFGPVASYWSPRRELAGTYDAIWVKTTRPLLPADYDERFTLCSPSDQRAPGYLHGGEPVHLVNMTPEGVLRTALPKVGLSFVTRIKGRREQHHGRMVTVILEPDERRLMAVWHTSLRVAPTELDHLVETNIEQRLAAS